MTETSDLNHLKVLVVDDAIESRHLVTRTLERFGATVDAAENGLEGVTKAIREQYDVILMDIHMPVLDGFQATDHLRKCGFNGPIVACTGVDLGDERGSFDDVVSKPIDLLVLLRRLRRFHLLKMVREYASH